MDTKHLSKGSKCPPLSKGKLRFYNMRFCPYAHRVQLVLDAKKIPCDIVNIHLAVKPEWYFDKNPVGKVPAIELESGDCLYESLVVADYLDEKYPKNPLHSKDPVQKAKDRLVIERFGNITGLMFKFYRNSDSENLENLLTELDHFEKELASRGSPFFGGEKPGMVDYMIWPWMERTEAFKIVAGEKLAIPKNRYPKMEQWKKSMKDDEAVKVSFIDSANHAEFVKSFLTGTPNYDIMAKL